MYKNIENIEIGDFVQGETEINQVLFRHEYNLENRLLYSINKGAFFVTECHPFKTTNGWKAINPKLGKIKHFMEEKITALEVGDILLGYKENIKIKSIDFKASKEQKIYDLELSGDRTYYADDYLVHNKNFYRKKDSKKGDNWEKKEKVFLDYKDLVDDQYKSAKDAFSNLSAQIHGITMSDGENEQVGGEMIDIDKAFNDASNDYKTSRAESAVKIQSQGKEIGAAAAGQSAELTSMIGKTNLAGAGSRQQQELQKAAVEKFGGAQAAKETELSTVEDDMAGATTERNDALANLVTKSQGEFSNLEEQIKTDFGSLHSGFKSSYNSAKGESGYHTSSGELDFRPSKDMANAPQGKGEDLKFDYTTVGELDNEFGPVPKSLTLGDGDFKLPSHHGRKMSGSNITTQGYDSNSFKQIRIKKSGYNSGSGCFIAGTKILMGVSDGR